jgi:hypothetical protein
LFFQEEENGLLWGCFSEQLLDAMLIHIGIIGGLKLCDFMNDLLELSLPIGSVVVIVDDLDLDVRTFLDIDQIQDVSFIEKGYIDALFSSAARPA